MSNSASPIAGQPYGVKRTCSVLGFPRSSYYDQLGRLKETTPRVRRRPGPVGAMPDDALVAEIRKVIESSPFHGEGYRKVWARLRFKGINTSKERTRRLMRENGLQACHRAGNTHGPKAHDGTIITDIPDEMWGTDMTTVHTLFEGNAAVFIAVDHCTSECVGIHAAKHGNRFEALEPIRQAVNDRFGAFAQNVAPDTTIRHDHGSAYMSHVFQDEIRFLGCHSSPAYIREPEGNGCAERFIRTLKENLLWVIDFATVEELRQALQEFKDRYNNEWILQRHGYLTPTEARRRRTQQPTWAAA